MSFRMFAAGVGLAFISQVALAEAPAGKGVERGYAQAAEHALNSYAAALDQGNAFLVQKMMSAHMQEQIAGRYGSAEQGIQHRLGNEQQALKNARAATGAWEYYQVKSVQANEDGSRLVVDATFAGADIGKSIVLVREDGAYRIDGVSYTGGVEAQQTAVAAACSTDDFRVNNQTTNSYLVTCYNPGNFSCADGSRTFGPGDNTTITCPSYCGWVGGTTFNANGLSATCAYNLVGVDMWLMGSYLKCANPC